MNIFKCFLVKLTLIFLLLGHHHISFAKEAAIYSNMDTAHPVWSKNGMVASQEALASEIGLKILKDGGNAVDAAVAIGFALAVTLPRAGNLGGGGFMMVHLAKTNDTVAIDYRETAPAKTHQNIFLDEQGNVVPKLSRTHGLAIGVPGTVKGFELALKKYGTMSLHQVIAPAIALAEKGIIVTPDLANSLIKIKKRISQWPSSKRIFYKKNNQNYQPGERFSQVDLAHSLKQIALLGSKGFYQGEIAEKIINAVQDAGGVMTQKDLQNYKAIVRQPTWGEYRGYQIASMPPPSSGGVHIIQMLNMLEEYPIRELGHNSAKTIHLMAEVMKRAYADRSEYLGDPDFVKVPLKGLTDKEYAKALNKKISDKATPSELITAGKPLPYESNQTTHYSVIDKWGNAVSNTYTLNFSYGSGLVAEGTGIILNNEMDDFSAKAGVPNAYGMIGGDANSVQKGKRPLSSMSPTLVFKNKKPFLVTGSPGGSRIITTTLQMILNVIDHDMNVAEATMSSRIHHQWFPDEIRVEKSLNKDTVELLRQKGHKVKRMPAMGSTQSIMLTDKGLWGYSDLRRSGALTTGY
jgi:gamma-glutamyltranspeptidase/glutathione hydrolase